MFWISKSVKMPRIKQPARKPTHPQTSRCRFSWQHWYGCTLYLSKKDFYSPVYLARFSNCWQKFQLEKKVWISIIGIKWMKRRSNWGRRSYKNRYFSKWLICRALRWLYDQNFWKMPVKKFSFSKVADL